VSPTDNPFLVVLGTCMDDGAHNYSKAFILCPPRLFFIKRDAARVHVKVVHCNIFVSSEIQRNGPADRLPSDQLDSVLWQLC